MMLGIIILLQFLIVSKVSFVSAQGMMGYGGWGGFGFGWIFMIIFWALIILGMVALVRYLRGTKQNDAGKTPIDILKERYAKGEINKKEFEEMKKELQL